MIDRQVVLSSDDERLMDEGRLRIACWKTRFNHECPNVIPPSEIFPAGCRIVRFGENWEYGCWQALVVHESFPVTEVGFRIHGYFVTD